MPHSLLPWGQNIIMPRDELCISSDDFMWDGNWKVEERVGVTDKYYCDYGASQDEFSIPKGLFFTFLHTMFIISSFIYCRSSCICDGFVSLR